HNGQIRETTEALLSPGQVGFMNGWGVFSTIRVAEGVLFAFERHYARMRRDAERMRVPFEPSPSELQKTLLTLVEANRAANATLRVAVVRNQGNPFASPGITRPVDWVAFTAPLTQWGEGVKLGYMPNARYAASPFAGTKFTSWGQNLTLYEEAHELGFDEWVLLNEFGQVSECTSANLFAIRAGELVTPPLRSSGCLAGVTRALLLEEVAIPGYSAVERDLLPADLERSEQVFITSTTRDLLPVLEIDGRALPQKSDVIGQLQQAFRDYRARYVAAHLRQRETTAR
ncbi:MAG TPA: aminotransferase class IV, partial [Bryobacteraceae bacterium]|nr:aminotransferase class IV [Bryobacteraceae bacterium]